MSSYLSCGHKKGSPKQGPFLSLSADGDSCVPYKPCLVARFYMLGYMLLDSREALYRN